MNIIDLNPEEQQRWDRLFKKCYEDETFKRALIANPVQTIESLSGKPMNLNGLKLVITDQSEPALYMNIPIDPDSIELTENQLELVAGGKCMITGCVITTINF